jgi:hypothetical protein
MTLKLIHAFFCAAFLCAPVLCSTTAVAATPLAGTWKLDVAKSKMTGDTFTLASEPGGMIKYSFEGQSYSFKLDGPAVQTPSGMTAKFKKVDDSTWESTRSKGSTLIETATWKLSPDGKQITINPHGTKPDGSKFSEQYVYARETGTTGFYGHWKSTKATGNNPDSYKFEDQPDGSMVWTIPDLKAQVKLKFDGADYPATGPTVPDGLTLAVTSEGSHKFALVEKIKGKTIYKSTYTIAADGKTMTEVGGPVAVNEPFTLVFNKE